VSGYRWDPVFRVVPFNGAERVYWLADRMTDLRGHGRAVVRYQEDKENRIDLNREMHSTVRGLRPEVDLECTIFSMDDQAALAEIESALLQPRRYFVYLSMDGGHVERRVVLNAASDITPVAGKTIVGAVFRISVVGAKLIDERPTMMVDLGLGEELVQDGGFEQWVAGVPQAWSGSSGIGTVAEESTIVRSGLRSAKVTRSDGLTSFVFQEELRHAPKTGGWYRYRGYGRSSIDLALAAAGPFLVAIWNFTKDIYVASDGKTWDATSGNNLVLGATLAASFTQFEAYFRASSVFLPTDRVYLRHQGYWAGTQSVYYDDESIYGPVLRPGVSTW